MIHLSVDPFLSYCQHMSLIFCKGVKNSANSSRVKLADQIPKPPSVFLEPNTGLVKYTPLHPFATCSCPVGCHQSPQTGDLKVLGRSDLILTDTSLLCHKSISSACPVHRHILLTEPRRAYWHLVHDHKPGVRQRDLLWVGNL